MAGARFTPEDLNKLKLVEKDGIYQHASKLVSSKVEKLPGLFVKSSFITVNHKPLSSNQAWQGKRFKTPKYKSYEKDILLLLPTDYKVPSGELKVTYEFGFSNSQSDYDNPIKNFQDILQTKYGFNDSKIMEAHIKKIIVKRGQEYIKFKIESYI